MASSITAQGRDLTKTMDKVNEDYWYNKWHLDFELHSKLGIKDVKEVSHNEKVSIYADTDSCDSKSLVITDSGNLTIEEWYNKNIKNGSAGTTLSGHESVSTQDKILNYSENFGLYFAPVKRIIRHKVSKTKWRLRTRTGKEIVVTDDHSMIVFREGKKVEVRPSEILKSDKILILKSNIY